ncbi:hypothetical protein [uncultured Aquabacterium sp.]|uniref:hypothetical protein n=1 Tax=uncultured Aquabacterium sp. TaxID=158753 RepID=UPI0025F31C72|nr:hypothetical protein [uncultured Aquabacterium sp.]
MSNIPTAYQGELMLAGWNETHTGGAKVTFWLPDSQALEPFRHMTVKKGNTAGQRFMAVLVLLDEQDRPVSASGEQPKAEGGPLAKSAALVCNSRDFQDFVAHRTGVDLGDDLQRRERAAQFLRGFCEIDSRAELDSSAHAAELFRRLMAMYREWMADRQPVTA